MLHSASHPLTLPSPSNTSLFNPIKHLPSTATFRSAADPIVFRQLVNPPDCCERVILVVDHLTRGGLDIGHGQGIDSCDWF